MGALERLNLALKILSGRYAPTRSEIENLKSSLRVDAGPMSAEELASEVIHHELSRHRAPSGRRTRLSSSLRREWVELAGARYGWSRVRSKQRSDGVRYLLTGSTSNCTVPLSLSQARRWECRVTGTGARSWPSLPESPRLRF